MKGRKRYGSVLSGYLILFLTITAVVSAAVSVYAYAERRSGGDKKIIAIVILSVIFFLALLCTLIDSVRRTIAVERPVNKILDATDRIARGDFAVRLAATHSPRRYDEFDAIMENLNKMVAELSRNEMLHNDFISNVSHEIKTPLAVIANYATLLCKEDLSDSEKKAYARTLAKTATKLSDLVVNILKLNKLENQKITPEAEPVRLDESLAQAVLTFEDAIERKNLQLECNLAEVTVHAVPAYLELVWNNLLSNAIKFTDAGGKIQIDVFEREGKAAVRVADSGCGISPETGKRIFEKFYQGDTSHAQEGNGLGLALVKKVIEKTGGEINVDSEEGKGTAFTVTLNGARI